MLRNTRGSAGTSPLPMFWSHGHRHWPWMLFMGQIKNALAFGARAFLILWTGMAVVLRDFGDGEIAIDVEAADGEGSGAADDATWGEAGFGGDDVDVAFEGDLHAAVGEGHGDFAGAQFGDGDGTAGGVARDGDAAAQGGQGLTGDDNFEGEGLR